MSRYHICGWTLVLLFAAAVASPVWAADEKPATKEKPAVQKLKLAVEKPASDKKAKETPVEEEEKGGKSAEEGADAFTVPDGTPKELVEYVTKMITGAPPADEDAKKKMRKAILEAAEKILAGKPNDEEMEFAVQAKMNMLENREQLTAFAADLKKAGHAKLARQVRGFMLQIDLRSALMGGEGNAKKSVEASVKYLEEATPQVSDITLAYMTGLAAEMSGDKKLAANTYGSIAKVFAASKNPKLAEFAKMLEGVVRRLNLVGKEIKIEGKILGKGPFDWAKYKGKVVLVEFWMSTNPNSAREISNLKGCYEMFHDKGFEIIGISLDRDEQALEKFVKAKNIPWSIVVGDGKPCPSVVYYGIMNLPTMILVGKDGLVTSINARGETLREELEVLLGPVSEKKTEKKAEKEDAEKPAKDTE